MYEVEEFCAVEGLEEEEEKTVMRLNTHSKQKRNSRETSKTEQHRSNLRRHRKS